MEKFVEEPQQKNQENMEANTNLVSNGAVDRRGMIADKQTTGGWKASPYIIASEVAERLAFFAIASNLVPFLVLQMGHQTPDAASYAAAWHGTAFILTIFGAFVADSYLGRYKTIMTFSCIYATGMVLLTLSTILDNLRPPPCEAPPCTKATNGQAAFLIFALGLIAVGTGGIKPCVSAFGAEQFDEADEKEVAKKSEFFNWFFFAINMGGLLSMTLIVYIQAKKGWSWGFAIPAVFMILSVIVLIAGVQYYRFQKPMGSVITRFLQVITASLRNHFKGVQVISDKVELYEVITKESDIMGAKKLPHTTQYLFLDKAAVVSDLEEVDLKNRWKLCTVTQVEELKSLIRVLPIWLSTLVVSLSFTQSGTFFISQALIMDRKLGPNFEIPTASVPSIIAIIALLFIPIYEKWIVPILRKHTGQSRGITSLQRIGVGMACSILCLGCAALVETKRREISQDNGKQMGIVWLFPQYCLLGCAEVFAYVGQMEFYYDEASDGTRSIGSALFLVGVGMGSWLCSALVKVVGRISGGPEKGWLRNDLNQSRLDYFYWLLTAICGFSFLIYLLVSQRYKSRERY